MTNNELFLDPDPSSPYYGDLYLDANGGQIIAGPANAANADDANNPYGYAAAVAQRLQLALSVFQGEYAYDPTFGIPYFQEILGENNQPHLLALYTAAILETPGVLQILAPGLSVSLNKTTRLATFAPFSVLCENGEVATINGVAVGGGA